MTRVGSYQAKTHLPALLKRVEDGERITITRHGQPIALIVPYSDVEAMDRARVVEGLLRFRSGRALGRGLTVRDLMDHARR
ncbi:MAG: type II toxin-antitoxin system prevent-host-death family antitoxin [Gemmatimonadales bacterium]|jgi:prevent-host-death family protein|nr:MAG: type II toxin-antitoxin system prevent-host-death family antitoxin [Gemmatimonadales bacterium]